jgi:hypothetical protein
MLNSNNSSANDFSFIESVSANGTYHDFSGGNLNFAINTGTANMITTNNDWSGVQSVEGYNGDGLSSNNQGLDPQLISGTGTTGNTLPASSESRVAANQNNPSAHNNGGVMEFDQAPNFAIGLQGKNGANPYLVYYLNTTGSSNIRVSFEITDIDGGTNNAVSPIALQYRIGETGSFVNIPEGFIADATDGPNISGRVTSINLFLPAACDNQAQVQVRIIANDAVGQDEWIGINNVVFSNLPPTSANVSVGGRALYDNGSPVSRAQITMLDSMGNTRTATTNSFGYYRFDEVEVGQTYILEINSRKIYFPNPTRIVSVEDNLSDVDFIAQSSGDDAKSFPANDSQRNMLNYQYPKTVKRVSITNLEDLKTEN